MKKTVSGRRFLAGEFISSERGSVAPIFAAAAIALTLAMGVAVDYSRALNAQKDLQAAVDAATLTGASSDAVERQTIAADMLKVQSEDQGLLLTNATYKTNADNTFVVSASAELDTTFTALFGKATIPVEASATAALPVSTAKVCILLKDPSASQAFLVNSGASITGKDCEIHVASTGSPAAIFNASTNLDVKRVCIKGSNIIKNGGTISKLETSCTTVSDPFAGALPKITAGSCTVSDKNYSGTNALSPGVYCGNFNFNGTGTLNLASGLYVFKGTRWNLNSGWKVNGTGVTFYFADANSYIQVNSGVEIKITAPASGTYAGILMYEPDGLSKSQFSINGSAGHVFEGLFYLPSRNITFNAVSSVNSEAITMVFNTLIVNDMKWNIAPGSKAIDAGGSGGATVWLKR